MLQLIGAVFTALLLLTSCNTLNTVTDAFKGPLSKTDNPPLYKNKADMYITINRQKFSGVAVAQLKDSVEIKIESKAKLDLLTISSCHRHFTHEKADKNWYGGVGREYKYKYNPTPIEKEGPCPIYIQAFDRRGITAWGYIVFKTDEKLNALVECNGEFNDFAGASVCQSKNKFIQGIRFEKSIIDFEGSSGCHIKEINNKSFEVTPDLGFCYATFYDGVNWHRATFLAYDDVLIRSE